MEARRRGKKQEVKILHFFEFFQQAMRQVKFLSLFLGISLVSTNPAWGLPPPEDVPEEVLRTEIITEARSPIDGKPLSAAEYAQLQAQIAEGTFAPEVNPQLRQLIFLLHLRQLFRTVIPFL